MLQRTPTDHSIEAEQEVLGAILVNNAAMQYAAQHVGPEHFFEPFHQSLFDVMQTLINMGKVVTPVTVAPFVPADVDLGGVNGKQYVARLAASATTIINTPDYAQLIRDYADRRAARAVIDGMFAKPQPDPVQELSDGISALDSILAQRVSYMQRSATMEHAVTAAIDKAAQMYQRDGAVSGIPSGLRDLDAKLLGFEPGNLIFVAGRPGSGKSALVTAILRNILRAEREAGLSYRAMLASLEMNETEIGQRMLADHIFDRHRMTYHKIRQGSFSEQEFMLIRDAALELQKLPLTIEQRSGMTFGQIASKARQLKRTKGLDILAIDHIHLMKTSGQYGNLSTEIGREITGPLKALAKELEIPVIALAQLNRGPDGREDKRPNLSDLKQSGDIEQDADVVIMMYREAYYIQNREPKPGTPEHEKWQSDMDRCWLRAHAIIEKQRMGPLGAVELFCDIGCNALRDGDYVRGGGPAYLPRQDSFDLR